MAHPIAKLHGSARADWRGWPLLFGLLAALHVLMLGYDLHHPGRFLNADRAGGRMQVLEGFRRTWEGGGDLTAFLAQHGIVGDWLPQALLYLWGGQYLVIVAQVALALASVAWVRSIGTRLGMAEGSARGAALLYGLLPHTVVLPHQLASEAIFVPLLVGSFALLVRSSSARGLALAGALLGLATLVRPITLLWPLVCVLFLSATLRARALFVLAALTPLYLWMLFVFAATGDLSMGRSDHDLGRNLYERAERIAASAGVPAPESPTGDRRLGVAGYLRFALDHPSPALEHSARDVAVLALKSGTERVVLDYLEVDAAERAELQASDGWRARLERDGAWATFRQMTTRHPGVVLAAAGGAIAFAALMLLAFAGALAWLRENRDGAAAPRHRLRLLLVLFPLYIAATAQVVDAAQSRHRAPAELALCLLAVAGLPVLRRRLSRTFSKIPRVNLHTEVRRAR
ncbi:MAG TPA: hypothetical protein VFB01_14445 [Burkholderiales bacterium]|nr:hypothetical protein [Burkholderiales bacterium]